MLLHQSPSSSAMFGAVMSRLAERGLRVIATDTPGFGMSDVPPAPPEIADYAHALLTAMDGLNVTGATVLGHHTGASIATEMALAQPDRVSRLILNGPPVLSEAERRQWQQAVDERPHPELKPDGSHFIEQWEKRLHFTPGWTSLEAMHIGVLQMFIAGETEWYGHRAAFAHDLSEALQRVKQPTLILTNTGDDIYASAQAAIKLRPDFDYKELEGGTHDIVDEQPDAWSDIVAEYVHG